MQCVILAGGLGTRMRPATETVPKALLPVAGEPFAAHQLELLRRGGVREVVYCIGHLGDQVRDYVGDGRRFGLGVSYVDEGEELLGTGGALRHADREGALHDEFLVLYGDSYLPIDFRTVRDAFAAVSEPALMTVFHNAGRIVASNVEFDGRRVTRYDKRQPTPAMEWVDYGVSAMQRAVLGEIPIGAPADLSDLFHELSVSGRLAGLAVDERFYEIGSTDGLREVEDLLAHAVSSR
jgi:NDP-sugar pyrophosphorylase family protein